MVSWLITRSASYIMGARKDFDKKEFKGKVKQKMTKEVFMSTLSILVKEGEERGEKRGEKKGREEGERTGRYGERMGIAAEMLRDKKSDDEVKKYTRLTSEEIKELRKKL